MKGIQGLIVAVGLGVVGAVLNYFYLAGEAKKIQMVSFIGLKPEMIVGRGDRLTADHLVEVRIPESAVGNLRHVAFLWDELRSVENTTVWRTLGDSSLLLRSDIKTPPPELQLGKDETAAWIPVDSRAFVPSLLLPGDTVSFILPVSRQPGAPTPAPAPPGHPPTGLQPKPEDPENVNQPGAAFDPPIGPFKILAVGNRLGSPEVMRAAKVPQLQENVLTIRVSKQIAGEEARFQKLWKRLQESNFRQVGIILNPRAT
jgi:hypothetical protein